MLPDLSNDPRWAVPIPPSSAFLAKAVKHHEEFMRKDLLKSGLLPSQVRAHVTDIMPLSEGAEGGYFLPYFDLDGRVMRHNDSLSMYRLRQYGHKDRYKQPWSGELEKLFIPSNPPYILPAVHTYIKESKVLYIAEGEKKAACCTHYLDIGAIGIGGCWNWGIKKKLHPWIKELIARYQVDTVRVIPDGDILRYDICTAYGTMADELRRLGVTVEIVKLPSPEDKIDDLIVHWGVEAQGNFADLGKLESSALVVSQHSLAETYGLSVSGKAGNVVVNDTNVRALLEHHPSFETFWLNVDTNDYMHGQKVVQWDLTDYELTCYMQHYFQLHNLNRPRVAEGMRAIADGNKRSPFKDWVDKVAWDGTPRLEDWAIRLWGCADMPATREVASEFMVGMYARMASPGCKMDWMLVTVGGQGIGKSWWADLVTKGQFVSFMSSGNARDDAAKIHKGMVILIDELDAFNKREMTYWKTMITTHVDTYRAPYARGEVTLPRRSVLYGTSNHRTFLRHDSTGQRRFGVLEPTCMLHVQAFNAELQQLWAEAKSRFLGECTNYWELSAETKAAVSDEFQGDDPLIEQVERWLVQWPTDKFKMLNLLEGLEMKNSIQNRGLTGPLKDMLIKMGCIYKKNMRVGGGSPSAGYTIDRARYPYNPDVGGKY